MDPARNGSAQGDNRWTSAERTILTRLIQELGNPSQKSEEYWKAVSSGLGQYGYQRSSTACRFYWRAVQKLQIAQIGGTIWNSQQVSSPPSDDPRSTPVPTPSRHSPYSNKRGPAHPYHNDRNTGHESNPRHAKRLKRLPVGNMLCENAVEFQPLLSPEALADTSLDVSPTEVAQEQGRVDVISSTAGEKGSVSHSPTFAGGACSSDVEDYNESQSRSAGQHASNGALSTALENQQTPMTDGFDSITVEIGGQTVNEQDGSSNSSCLNSPPAENQSCTVQPEIESAEAVVVTTSNNKEEQVEWASRQVNNLEAEIQKLKSEVTARTLNVTSIEEQMEKSQEIYDMHRQNKQEEIARVLRELEEQHRQESEAFESKLSDLEESKQSELRKLESFTLRVSRKEKGLVHFQGIVDYYNNEDMDKI
jgi:hypothetical protein